MSIETIRREAGRRDLDPGALRAFAMVESPGAGFLDDGRCRVVLRGEVLWRRLQAAGIAPWALHTYHPELCFPELTTTTRKYTLGGPQEWDRIARAIAFGTMPPNPRRGSYELAVYEACAWGRFGLLGAHYAAAGYRDVIDLKTDHEKHEAAQLKAILRWMESNGLLDRLRRLDWQGFAAGYNGHTVAGKYASRLAKAYRSFGALVIA